MSAPESPLDHVAQLAARLDRLSFADQLRVAVAVLDRRPSTPDSMALAKGIAQRVCDQIALAQLLTAEFKSKFTGPTK